jgi:hypothetical protein
MERRQTEKENIEEIPRVQIICWAQRGGTTMNVIFDRARIGTYIRLFIVTFALMAGAGLLSAKAVLSAELTITSSAPSAATAGAAYSFTFTATGGTSPYTWKAWLISPEVDQGIDYAELSSGSPINGMYFDSSTGILSGAPVYTGALPFRIKVTDSAYRTQTLSYDFSVAGTGVSRSITNTPPSGTEGVAYSFTFATTWSSQLGCDPSLYFIDGSLPPGLSLNILSGDLGAPPAATGTPSAAGAYTFTLSAATSTECIAEPTYTNAQTFTINIGSAATSSSPAGASGWSKSASNPVLTPSTSGWDNGLVASPSVIKVGGAYMMYYEGQDTTSYTWHIGLATSSDGITWTKSSSNPVLSPGASGNWDSFEVRYPSVHYDGSTYRMWYWGRSGIDNAAMIGLATSSDGVTWTKHSSAVLGTDGYSSYIPGSVIKSDGTFVMWLKTQGGDMLRATSSDGITWSSPATVISDQSLKSGPSVILDDGVYRAWFGKWDTGDNGGFAGTVSNEARMDIGYAYSSDGITWTQYTNSAASCSFCVTSDNIIASLSHGAAGAWDRPGVGQPSVLKDGSSYKMWYTGGRIHRPYTNAYNTASFVEGSIGCAVSAASGASLVKNDSTSSFYSSIQTAYNAAATGQSLLMQAVEFTEDLTLSGSIAVSLLGGYDSSFSSTSGFTIVNGVVTIKGGPVTLSNIEIK